MTGSEIVSIIISLLGGLAGLFSAVAYFTNRGKDRQDKGERDGEIMADIKYMRNRLDDVGLDFKEFKRDQTAIGKDQNERITRLEESTKQAHKRIDAWESKDKE